MVGIMAPRMHAVFWPQTVAEDHEYARMDAMLADCDLVLVEGHATGRGKKIEVWRAATGTPPLASHDASILAVVSDDAPDVSKPVWSRSDVPRLVNRILELAGLRERKEGKP